MNKNTILILIILSGVSQAKNSIKPELQHRINADIALVHSVKQLEQVKGSGGYIGVGADASCNGIGSIQQALDLVATTGQTEIRVARNKTYNENLIIDDLDVSIIGGYLDCFNMTLPNAIGGPGNNQSVIDAGNVGSVIQISNTTQRRVITLKNLLLKNGNTGGSGGGLIADNANSMLSLKNVDLKNNTAFRGAGMAIISGDTDVLLENSSVDNNTAKLAGGIYCTGALSSVTLIKNSGITSNNANGLGIAGQIKGNGGGIYLDGCYFSMYSGSATDPTIGITSNSASGDGGGIYATNNATVVLNGHEVCDLGNCIGDDTNPASVSANTASSGFVENSGGGIYADDGTIISINAGLIANNNSINNGGGIYINNAQLEISRLKMDCWDNTRCNYIDGNFSEFGGALFSFQSESDISSTTFENNLGSIVIFLSDSTSQSKTRIEGSIFNNNGDFDSNGNPNTESIVHIIGELNVEVIHSTFADNNTLFSFSANPGVNGNPFLQIHSTIIDNFNTQTLAHTMNSFEVNISNIIANEILSLSSANNLINQAEAFLDGPVITIDDPMFVDRSNRNYHLSLVSPAIDYAITPVRIDVNYLDIDFQQRGIDDPNQSGPISRYYYDLGADEYYDTELIFKDGFEN